MSYSLKDIQEIEIDGGAGPEDAPADPNQWIVDLWEKNAGEEVAVVIGGEGTNTRVEIWESDFRARLLSAAAIHVTHESMLLAARAWAEAFKRGHRSGKFEAQMDIRKALGI